MKKKQEISVQIQHIGKLELTLSDDVFLIEDDEGYVQACRILMQAQSKNTETLLHVTKINHFEWLKQYTERIGLGAKFVKKTARTLLSDQWNVNIPEWLSDKITLDQKLLDLKVNTEHQIDFIDCILSHFLTDIFISETFNKSKLVEMLTVLTGDKKTKIFMKYPVLDICLKKKIEKWKTKSNTVWIKSLCDHLSEDINSTWKTLTSWSILNSYPEKLLEFVLPNTEVQWVRKVPKVSVAGIFPESSSKESAFTQIELFFKDIRSEITSSEKFQNALNYISGELIQEFQFLSSLLKNGLFDPVQKDIDALIKKFKTCVGINSVQLNALKKIIKPKEPAYLNEGESFTAKEWVEWSTTEYIPYRAWQIQINSNDKKVEKTVAKFSNFYLKNFVNIHTDPELSLLHSLSSFIPSTNDNKLYIVLLIDCLPVQFFNLLEKSLQNGGFNRFKLEYRYAPVPSVTDSTKPYLLAGKWDPDSKDYESILKKRTEFDWGGKKIAYFSNLKQLSNFSEIIEPAILVLNTLEGDGILHSDVESKNSSYDEELFRFFNRITDSVKVLSESWERSYSPDDLNIIVVTDHGACRILETEKNTFDSKIVNKLFPNEKYRYCKVTEDQVNEIPENIWEMGNKFNNPFIAGDEACFLPMGHNTVRSPGQKNIFSHGGITPEEIIVPVALYKPVKQKWKSLNYRFLDLILNRETRIAEFYIQRVVSIEIEIQNPNSVNIQLLYANILSPETDLKWSDMSVVKAEDSAKIRIDCYFKKLALKKELLEIELTYEVGGEENIISLKLKSKFKSALTTGFSLKEL